MTKLFYTKYLKKLGSYVYERPEKKALILLGYIQRDFLQYYRNGQVVEGVAFIQTNVERNRNLIKVFKTTWRYTPFWRCNNATTNG